ncbi:hypothetical protein CEXT_598001 [Caerostris extrusa]|uniref:Uncharacterized protein n=1 Tax=Caerostris extrusa TaxID=172846 RepID=A0AAV4NQW8_CAEEX|nr:hypothetical protein CEXT_598001 [Caerostris extrusa]
MYDTVLPRKPSASRNDASAASAPPERAATTKGASPRQSRNAPFHRLLLILAINFEMIEFLPRAHVPNPFTVAARGNF